MGCEQCEAVEGSGQVYWFRWGAANIGIIACGKHFMEVREALMATQAQPKEEG